MANRHFGEIGDGWKHLALAELLTAAEPARYWETHASSADYPLTPSPRRAYGVYRLLARAPDVPALAGSAYLRVLRPLAADGRYPGSPAVALRLLSGRADHVFCDLDPVSLSSIRAAAAGLAPRLVLGDGVAAISAALADLPADQAPGTLAFLDPYQPLHRTEAGSTAVELWARLGAAGVLAVLWYGFDSAGQRALLRRRLHGVAAPAAWLGEITVGDSPPDWNPGFGLGCGLAVANASQAALDACARLGGALETAYSDALLPDGSPGRLVFRAGA